MMVQDIVRDEGLVISVSLCYAAGDCPKEEWGRGLREAKCGVGAPIPIAFGRSFREKLKSKVPHF
jgi:hypothetical protein